MPADAQSIVINAICPLSAGSAPIFFDIKFINNIIKSPKIPPVANVKIGQSANSLRHRAVARSVTQKPVKIRPISGTKLLIASHIHTVTAAGIINITKISEAVMSKNANEMPVAIPKNAVITYIHGEVAFSDGYVSERRSFLYNVL